MRRTVVLVPDAQGVAALAEVPGVEAVVFRPGASLPSEADRAEILVAVGIAPEEAPALLAALPRLRMVQLFSSGTDRWASIVPEGVHVSNADRAHGGAVAEWVVGQLLGHYRDFAAYRQKQQCRQWEAHRTGTLSGANVLVFGVGDIGEAIRTRLEPFGCRLTMVGRTARKAVVDPAAGKAALPAHDVVVLAVPLGASTIRMADAAFLASMKDGAVLVNVGRGRLVDTDALLAECGAGRLRAILDVTDPEPLPPGHPLWTTTGVVLTPHAAAITVDIRERCWSAAARNIAGYLAQ